MFRKMFALISLLFILRRLKYQVYFIAGEEVRFSVPESEFSTHRWITHDYSKMEHHRAVKQCEM